MANKFWLAAVMGASIVCTHVCMAAGATVGDMEDVTAETMMLKAQAKKAEAANDLAKQRGGIATTDGKPVLQSIVSSDYGTTVAIACDGELGEAAVGGAVPCGWRVARIVPEDLTAVLVRGKERMTLEMTRPMKKLGGDVAKTNGQAVMGSGPMVPGLGR